jgi:hypothetical protein
MRSQRLAARQSVCFAKAYEALYSRLTFIVGFKLRGAVLVAVFALHCRQQYFCSPGILFFSALPVLIGYGCCQQ